ncbi:unnamed protein product [Closterium sp. Yama58-4]|nr:unnamed protein product [Closterium sp. Yama58-4]
MDGDSRVGEKSLGTGRVRTGRAGPERDGDSRDSVTLLQHRECESVASGEIDSAFIPPHIHPSPHPSHSPFHSPRSFSPVPFRPSLSAHPFPPILHAMLSLSSSLHIRSCNAACCTPSAPVILPQPSPSFQFPSLSSVLPLSPPFPLLSLPFLLSPLFRLIPLPFLNPISPPFIFVSPSFPLPFPPRHPSFPNALLIPSLSLPFTPFPLLFPSFSLSSPSSPSPLAVSPPLPLLLLPLSLSLSFSPSLPLLSLSL